MSFDVISPFLSLLSLNSQSLESKYTNKCCPLLATETRQVQPNNLALLLNKAVKTRACTRWAEFQQVLVLVTVLRT